MVTASDSVEFDQLFGYPNDTGSTAQRWTLKVRSFTSYLEAKSVMHEDGKKALLLHSEAYHLQVLFFVTILHTMTLYPEDSHLVQLEREDQARLYISADLLFCRTYSNLNRESLVKTAAPQL